MNISVIIPVYNVERFVERCVTSIMNQTYTENVECIIVNDCTPDRSMEIVERLVAQYDGLIQFKLLYHECNRGIAAVRNTGMSAAIGDYTIQIDSDDYCEPDMLEKMYAKAVEEDADVVVADYFLDGVGENAKYVKQKIDIEKISNIKKMLNGELAGYLGNKLIKKELLQKYEIRTVEGVDNGEDWFIAIPLFYFARKIVHLHKAFWHYWNRPGSYTTTFSRKKISDIIHRDVFILNFLLKVGAYNELSSELLVMRMESLCALSFCSKGYLQKKCISYYRDITLLKIFKYCPFNKGRFVSLILISLGMLPVYNLIRDIMIITRRRYYNHIVLYQD